MPDMMKMIMKKSSRRKNFSSQQGQILLIILLIIAVGLTVALAIVSRSVSDIGISFREEESARVFSVAEAGIEEALKLGAPPPGGVTIGDITARVEKKEMGGQSEFSFPGEYAQGEIQTLWLASHDEQGNYIQGYNADEIDVYWGKTDNDSTIPALEVALIYKENGNFKLQRWGLDPDRSRAQENNFDSNVSSGSFNIGGKVFKYQKTLSLPILSGNNFLYALRLRFLYNSGNNEILGVKGKGNSVIPSQGACYESIATHGTSGITRKVERCQFYIAPPGIFDYVLFSEGNLEKLEE